MNTLVPFFLVFSIFFLSACAFPRLDHDVVSFTDGAKEKGRVFVEVMDTLEARQQGLMYREALAVDWGMLFVFEEAALHSFWMKNTFLPLDMIFISEDLRVVDVLQADPCEEDPCTIYTPREEVLYVLEVNQGFVAERGIQRGDQVFLYNP